ncbi:MAG: hypothetical protein HEP71_19995 [Roseivirga sp.]|nr:hypothetical protein [Roseivirga sp.]
MTVFTCALTAHCFVYISWASLPILFADIPLGGSPISTKFFALQGIELWSRLPNYILYALIPVTIYLFVQRLRYLGKLNEQHRNILESNLGSNSCDSSLSDTEPHISFNKTSDQVKENKDLFEIPLYTPVQQKAI